MNNFTQVQIYCKYDGCCFDDIQKSSKPFITININDTEEIVKQKALANENVKKHIEGKEIVKVIVIKGKIVNIVVK